MKKLLLYFLVIAGPFLVMVVVNESMRGGLRDVTPYSAYGFTAMNSVEFSEDACSWSCHNNTSKCMNHHVSVMTPYFKYINPLYFGMIRFLQASPGTYAVANIIFLVIGWPALMMFLVLRSLWYQEKINAMKSSL